MRSLAVAFPFFVLAASSIGYHGCQPSTAGSPRPSLAAAPSAAVSGAACGLTILYQNNGNGEIEPCG